MDTKTGPYQIVDLPPGRRLMINMLDLSGSEHRMIGLLEVDVTVPRQFMAEHRQRTGETLSFTGYLVLCLGRAVVENKEVQAYRKGRTKLLMFDDVDVGFMIELNRGEERILRGHVIRGANHKTYRDINREIRSVQSNQIPTSAEKAKWFYSAMRLPWPLSRLFKALFRMMLSRDPTIVTSMAGTVGISSVGMFGKGHAGWGIASGTHGLDLVVGGTSRRLAEVDGRIEAREMLSLTIIFDHDIIDGAPAARFTRRLVELIESGYGLGEN